MGANGKHKERIILDYIYRMACTTELNPIVDVEVERDNLWLTLEDGSIKSLVVVSAGRQEKQKLE